MKPVLPQIFSADWPVPGQIQAFTSTRSGGMSPSPYESFNLACHVGDDLINVKRNRQHLYQLLGISESSVQWMNQIHSTRVAIVHSGNLSLDPQNADASITSEPHIALAVMTADCLPLLLCNRQGTRIAAIHAGWRGLSAGIIEKTVAGFAQGDELLAWLGPAIGKTAFEVGNEVFQCVVDQDQNARLFFTPLSGKKNKWLADLYGLATRRLELCGVSQVYGGTYCTYTNSDHFFSYRKEGQTGRMATLIWMDKRDK